MLNLAAQKMTRFVCFISLIFALSVISVIGQTAIVENGFEKGTEKWEARGDRVSISSSKDQAESGEKSLKISGRSAFWQGAQLNIIKLLSAGKIYKFTASVKLGKNEKPDNLKMTIQRGNGGGDSTYDNLSAMQANADEWKTLSGTFKPTGGDGYILVYFEAERTNTSFFIDNFKIELAGDGTPKQSGVILQNDFEDMTAQNWGVRGDNVEMFSSNAGGSQSLKVTGRTQNWHGLQLDVSPLMFKGRTYQISVSVRLLKGQKSDSLKVTMQETPPKGEAKYTEITTLKTVTDSEWTTITGQYTATTSDNNLLLYVEAAGTTTSFFIDNFSISIPGTAVSVTQQKPAAETDIPSLYKGLAEYFPVGVAIWKGDLEGEHATLVKKHFNSITSENDMKFESVEPVEGVFKFDAADAQVNFAKANGMKVRGHTLCWHEQTPAWVFKDANGKPMTPTPENKALLLKRLESHIRTVVKHFGDNVYAWDVVNEVIDPAQPDGNRRSEWNKITGLDYIKTAFRVTREVAPKAKLFINEYSTTDPKKRKFLYDLIADLQKQGVPIDGVGHQMHENLVNPSKAEIIETINLFSGLKIENQITELDISVYTDYDAKTGYADYQSIEQKDLIKQGYRYRDFFDAFKALKGKITSVTFWSHSDDHTWLSKPNKVDSPLLFDRNLKSKFAFWGIIDPTKLPAM
jgi:endo-1,4-beta-xylanase